ncbi:MAG: SPOR domain-containing protein [Bacteroidales bacterium]|nr:SPOR domain-containing protein [Bacteroidales bacterium]
MDFSSLIRQALLEVGTVAVPHIGTFTLHHCSARLIQNEDITCVPPQNVVEFSNECADEKSFIQFIAQKTNSSEATIQKELSTFTDSIQKSLNENTPYVIENVGTIHPDGRFQSSIAWNANAFGLRDFSIHKLSEEEKKKSNLTTAQTLAGVVKTLFIASPILFGALLIPNILQVSQNPQFASIFRQTQVEMDFTQPEVPRPHEFKPIVEAEKPKPEPAPMPTEKPTTKAENKYFVVVGTFVDLSNAKKFAKKLQKENYQSGIIEGERNKVYLSAFANKAKAQQYVQQLRGQSNYASAWIYVKKS